MGRQQTRGGKNRKEKVKPKANKLQKVAPAKSTQQTPGKGIGQAIEKKKQKMAEKDDRGDFEPESSSDDYEGSSRI